MGLNARLVESRQYQKGGVWFKTVTVKAEDPKVGFTAGQLMDILLQIPGDIVPRTVVSMGGRVRQISFTVQFVPGEENGA
jgi:hypothetical protein